MAKAIKNVIFEPGSSRFQNKGRRKNSLAKGHVTNTYLEVKPKPNGIRKKDPAIILREIQAAVKRLNKIFSQYENIGEGLETQIQLTFSDNSSQLYYTLNNSWSESMKINVEKVIVETAAKYPQIIVMSTPH